MTMRPLYTIRQFFNDMRRQKLRTALTTFGIFWGTCSIILLFAFGKGIKESQLKAQKGLGENIAIFWPGITSKDYQGLPHGRRIFFTEEDIVMVKERAQKVDRISPEYSKWNVPMKAGKANTLRNIVGVWPEFGEMRNLIPASGSRFLNQSDQNDKRRVVFIGDKLKTDLFGEGEAVGQIVQLGGVPFTVVGVMQKKAQDNSYNGRDASKAFIPASTFKTMYSSRYLNDFVMQSKPVEPMKAARAEVLQIMAARYRFDPTDEEALACWDVTEGTRFLDSFFSAFQWFLVGIGIATLITGAIGVSNIMNVVLEERTKEIGIKMALGARKSFILGQFIVETLMITAIGGIAGFVFAYAIVAIFPALKLEDYVGTPTINLAAAIGMTALLGVIGFIAGIFPARRAANLEPVKALKLF
ncbi:ABC transporter permease [candidate division GN15 bacterium]|uniref:ABC transporter permease n=1 Tax=candidate division GN15 bacterium TaxID=2072418 RepID=A0A855X136_9BACT|nr:MAG: ABC transporter permease [candidate division GN15 bacterium]